MLLLLADAANAIDFSAVTPIVSAIGSLGFAIWFAYYTTTTTLPNQQKEHREAIRELAMTHATTIKDLVSEMKDARDQYDRWKNGHAQ